MKKRLFLTGDQGCGKSTLIRSVLGSAVRQAAGFLTVRTADGVSIQSPDGASAVPFLTLSGKEPVYAPQVFLQTAAVLLRKQAPFAVLDEIGGIELLSPAFHRLLDEFLEAGIPCLGVVKNASSAEKLCRRLQLGDGYPAAAAALRQKLAADPDTLLMETDARAAEVAAQWFTEYAHG